MDIKDNEHVLDTNHYIRVVEEYEKNFPYTIACANFIYELKQKNILVDFNIIFDDSIVDMVLRETSNYLAR